MTKVNVSIGQNPSVALSETRLKNLLAGDSAAAQRMGWFDSIKDELFHGGSKRAALSQLAREFDASQGTSALDRFIKLASFANPIERSQFMVSVGGTYDQPTVSYRIKQNVVKVDALAPGDRAVLDARLARVSSFDVARSEQAADWLGPHERHDLEAERRVVDDSVFQTGGVHKRFHQQSGVLRAEDKTGAKDFAREKQIADLAASRPDLERYVSTQKVIEQQDMATVLPGITSDKPHATVTLYDSAHVQSSELDLLIGNLTSSEAQSLLMQAVDMARVFYKNGVSHQDLHMHNLMVHKPVNPTQGNITLKAIDFGKSKVDVQTESDKLNDVRYLFKKQASSGTIETLRRDARERLGYDLDRQAKHYPLHKLMVQCARASSNGSPINDRAYDESIEAAGDRLIDALRRAESLPAANRDQAIDQAFNEAMNVLSGMAESFNRVVIPNYLLRG